VAPLIEHVDEVADFPVRTVFRSIDDNADRDMRMFLPKILNDGQSRVSFVVNAKNNLEVRIVLREDTLKRFRSKGSLP